jgi:DNA topoisomerase-1
LPKIIGHFNGAELSINIGRFGPYVKYGDAFVSLPRGENMDEVDEARAIALINEKQQADAPIAMYEGQPITKGKGKFGPFIKWKDLYINVTKAYDFDNLTQADCDDMIVKKLDKEANRYIQNWESENISIQNGRWGAFIKFGKLMLKITKKEDGTKYTPEELTTVSFEEVKKMILEQMPKAFDKPLKVAAKKSVTKKAVKKK